jgi:hypothetical protein
LGIVEFNSGITSVIFPICVHVFFLLSLSQPIQQASIIKYKEGHVGSDDDNEEENWFNCA